MSRLTGAFQLKDGERLQAVVRRHGITLWPQLLVAGLILIAPFFFLFALLKWHAIGMAIFALVEAAGVWLALRAFILWDANALVLTSSRLVNVDQHGFWKRRVAEILLCDIVTVRSERAGIGESLFNKGTLCIDLANSSKSLRRASVPFPERIRELINDARTARPTKPASSGEPNVNARLSRLHDLLATADAATLTEVEEILCAPSAGRS